jgi:hypothetical protein
MKDILFMTILGFIAGMISIFWTRIIKKDMIFKKFGKWLERYDGQHTVMFAEGSMLVKFIRCCFCLQVWIVFALELFYIVKYHPPFMLAFIGVFAALGGGNFVCEVIHAIRNR